MRDLFNTTARNGQTVTQGGDGRQWGCSSRGTRHNAARLTPRGGGGGGGGALPL